jgi:hypothetical protein
VETRHPRQNNFHVLAGAVRLRVVEELSGPAIDFTLKQFNSGKQIVALLVQFQRRV